MSTTSHVYLQLGRNDEFARCCSWPFFFYWLDEFGLHESTKSCT